MYFTDSMDLRYLYGRWNYIYSNKFELGYKFVAHCLIKLIPVLLLLLTYIVIPIVIKNKIIDYSVSCVLYCIFGIFIVIFRHQWPRQCSIIEI